MSRDELASVVSRAEADGELPEPFRAVYESHFDGLWRYLRRLGVSPADLEDAAQETFVTAFRRGASLRPDASLRGWLYGIARRVAYRHRRSHGRRAALRTSLSGHAMTQGGSDPVTHAEAREAWRLVEHFVGGLDARKADVFVLAELEGLTGEEIAQTLGVKPNTVWSRLRAAREAFGRYVDTMDARERGDRARLRHALLAQARGASPASTPGARRAVRVGVATQLGPLAPVGATTLASLKVFLGTLAIGSLGLVAVVVSAGDATPSAAPATEIAARRPSVPSSSAPRVVPGAVPRPVPPARPVEEPRSELAAGASTISRAEPGRTATAEDLAAQTRQLARVQAAVSAGEFERALQLLETSSVRGTQSLAVEASALRVAALCGAARDGAAKAEARRLAARAAEHTWASVARDGCPKKIDETTPGRR